MMTSHDFEPLLTVSKPVLEVESAIKSVGLIPSKFCASKYSLFRADYDVLTFDQFYSVHNPIKYSTQKLKILFPKRRKK